MSLRYKGGVISATPPTTTGGTSGTAKGVWTLQQQMQAQASSTWPLSPPTAVQVSRSLRFNSADSAYLNRTPASASNRKTWTWSGWVKRSAIEESGTLIGARDGTSSPWTAFTFSGTDGTAGVTGNCLQFTVTAGTSPGVYTTAIFRDPSAWYHIVLAVDTTQATASNRVKIYINNTLQTLIAGSGGFPSQNSDTLINSTSSHFFGNPTTYTSAANFYLTNIDFIDGQALTPSSFGQTNSTTGVWEPIQTVGFLTYGTNGFHLDFADNSGTTSTTLGKDTSGNSNNWTPNNFSVTAGTGNDSLVDTPTPYGTDTGAGGEVRGNYCTLNPLITRTTMTIVNGNLDLSGYTPYTSAYGTIGMASGKWYFEYVAYANGMGGIAGTPLGSQYPGEASDAYAWDSNNATTYNNNSPAGYGNATSNGNIVGVAFDADAGTLVFYKNGVSQGTAYSSIPSKTYFPVFRNADSGGNVSVNFGQRPFAYTAPSGFKALCTQNLPAPTVVQGDDYFNTVLYTGDGTSPRSITGVGFQPDFVWIKKRSAADGHVLNNAVAGVGSGKTLYSNLTSAEGAFDQYGYLASLNSDGFTTQSGSTDSLIVNANTATYVAWNWKANGAGSSNTAGTISSTVSANTTSGFSIVTYTGTGSNATVGHGLGATPSMIIVKKRSSATNSNWVVYFSALSNAATSYLFLNTTAAVTSGNTILWNSTAPTSTVFSVGTASNTNASSETYVAYCFAPVAGFSAFGSYTGNSSSNGPFIYTGFRPKYVLVKISSGGNEDWVVQDTVRSPYNAATLILVPNLSESEAYYGSVPNDILSNGFKIRNATANFNTNGSTYIYAAFAENPFKYALAR